MDFEVLQKMMTLFTQVTQISSYLFLNTGQEAPDFYSGIPLNDTLDYLDFSEILNHLSEFSYKNHPQTTSDSNSTAVENSDKIYILTTRNGFTYSLTGLSSDRNQPPVVILGPILTEHPDDSHIKRRIYTEHMLIRSRQRFLYLLSTLPVHSTTELQSMTQLVFWRFHPQDRQVQTIMKSTFVANAQPRPTEDPHSETETYRFLLNLTSRIANHEIDTLPEVIWNSLDGLRDLIMKKDGDQYLKYIAVIAGTLTFSTSLKSAFPYEGMFHQFWNGITSIHEADNSTQIIFEMTNLLNILTHNPDLSDHYDSVHINKALQFINTHFDEKISLQDLAEHLHLNAFYVSTIIKSGTGVTFQELLNRIRIRKGKQLLIQTKKSMHEISTEIGYNYQSHFTKIFRKLEGMTPTEFRIKFRSDIV